MKIQHQGWNETIGVFQCDITLDERREDHQIHFPNGVTYHQATPFFLYELDWNQTGESFGRFGAFFETSDSREFFTPLELASLVLNGRGYIPGLLIEDRQENLAERILAATRRAEVLNSIQNTAVPSLDTPPIQNL